MNQIEMPACLVSAVSPSGDTLLEWVQQQATSVLLNQIAENDHGEEAADHLKAIKIQLSSKPVEGLLPWCPREVLELERWNEPDSSGDSNSIPVQILHTRRLIACTLLLRSAAGIRNAAPLTEEEFFLDTSASTCLRFAASAGALGDDVALQGLEFLIWLHRELDYEPLIPFVAFCILLLWIQTRSPDTLSSTLTEMVTWVTDEESRLRSTIGQAAESKRWLVGLNIYEIRRADDWIKAVNRVLQQHKLRGDGPTQFTQLVDQLLAV